MNYTDEEFSEKVDYEGGIYDALEYGLRSADLENQTSALAKSWRELEILWVEKVEPLAEIVYSHLPDPYLRKRVPS